MKANNVCINVIINVGNMSANAQQWRIIVNKYGVCLAMALWLRSILVISSGIRGDDISMACV